MTLRILQELPYLTIYYDDNNEWLYAFWSGAITFEQAREGGEAVLRMVQTERCHKLLNDNSEVTDMWLETPEWRRMNVFPRLHAAGLRYVAWVYSANLYGRFSADRALQALAEPTALVFDDMDKAKRWLRGV